jgi:hypothetical protein
VSDCDISLGSKIIESVTLDLRHLLAANVPHLLGDKSKLSLRSPEEPPTGTAISLFLYQIAENAHYRNQEPDAVIDLY